MVAGWSVSDTDHATLWNGTGSIKLSDSNSRAFTVNDAGQVVGYSINAGAVHATLWSEFGATNLGTLGGLNGIAYTINNLGQVVGYSNIEGDVAQHATLWNGTSATDLGTLGGSFSAAISINDQGQTVGVATNAAGASYATLWNGTSAVALESLGGPQTFLPSINDTIVGNRSLQSFAWDINNSGQIVGYSNITDGLTTRATLWNNTTPIDLNSLLTASDVNAGWVLVDATGINDNGSIVGSASNTLLDIPYIAFLLSPVPEADTSAMLLIGLGVMSFMVRRRKKI
jgi:probable HAF family extracellular repeat protein